MENEEVDEYDDNVGLLNKRTVRMKSTSQFDPFSSSWSDGNPKEWQRKYWLGGSLCLILFAFWILDSLKDSIFGALVNGNLKRHQPIAKLVSVATTLGLVLFLELVANARKERRRRLESTRRLSNQNVLDEGGTWSRMGFQDDDEPPAAQNSQIESLNFNFLLVYVLIFFLIARILQLHPKYNSEVSTETSNATWSPKKDEGFTSCHVVGYFIYATIESFGSLAVASFWSFTNTTLSLEDAEQYYGVIVGVAQFGAIGGSTMVTANYEDVSLIIVACLVIVLHLVVMAMYTRRFRPTNIQAIVATEDDIGEVVEPYVSSSLERRQSLKSIVSAAASQQESSSIWSGVHLILRHNYVLLILGVSCLYEVSLTCLDYQLKLIGYSRFEETDHDKGITFTEFMGHYGQLVNFTSLFLSFLGFPLFIKKLGFKLTLLIFPTLLVIATVVAFGALPGNLAVLFVSMALLKAMTYSIHDPSKELLYLPTSNTIKFKAKFWIDIVGARVAKAIGSTINTYAGDLDRSVRVSSAPSLLTALLLW